MKEYSAIGAKRSCSQLLTHIFGRIQSLEQKKKKTSSVVLFAVITPDCCFNRLLQRKEDRSAFSVTQILRQINTGAAITLAGCHYALHLFWRKGKREIEHLVSERESERVGER